MPVNKRLLVVWLAILALTVSNLARAATVQTLPFGNGGQAFGIDGDKVVGQNSSGKAIVYDLSTHTGTQLNPPGAGPPGAATSANGISGNIIVGGYQDSSFNAHGFEYDGSSYTSLDDPSAVSGSVANGTYGLNVVGAYYDASLTPHGFLKNGEAWITIDDPLGSRGTVPHAIFGNIVVGEFVDSAGKDHGFLYNIITQSWTTLDDPAAPGGSYATGISGGLIVGSDGYIYDGTSFTHPLNISQFPAGTLGWSVSGISGDTVVGTYKTVSGAFFVNHAFVATIPEPSTLLLLGLGACCLAAGCRARNRGSPSR